MTKSYIDKSNGNKSQQALEMLLKTMHSLTVATPELIQIHTQTNPKHPTNRSASHLPDQSTSEAGGIGEAEVRHGREGQDIVEHRPSLIPGELEAPW